LVRSASHVEAIDIRQSLRSWVAPAHLHVVDPDTAIARSVHPRADRPDVTCFLLPVERPDLLRWQLHTVATVMALDIPAGNRMLIHGALVESSGRGVILTGPGGAGKTTATLRLPEPWRSASDDMCLVVRHADGTYQVHPWPTWSRFAPGGPRGSWTVERAVRLAGIFFLHQAETDKATPVSPIEACGTLHMRAREVCGLRDFIQLSNSSTALRNYHLAQFDTVCGLATTVPCFSLDVSLTGRFWDEMDRVLSN
jgi:SynChlorMet cassette protein ScmC